MIPIQLQSLLAWTDRGMHLQLIYGHRMNTAIDLKSHTKNFYQLYSNIGDALDMKFGQNTFTEKKKFMQVTDLYLEFDVNHWR